MDALVSDLSMPGMGGLALIREAHVRRPGLPAVLLTGYAGEAAHLAVSGAPPSAFSLLRKPVSVVQLVDRIEMVLATKTRTGGQAARLGAPPAGEIVGTAHLDQPGTTVAEPR